LKIIDFGFGLKATDARKIKGIVILFRVSVAYKSSNWVFM